jgi:hypothetical protein
VPAERITEMLQDQARRQDGPGAAFAQMVG